MARLFYYLLLTYIIHLQGVLVMKKLLLVFLLLLQIVILPQNNFNKQITSGDFDARNPFQPRIPFQSIFYYEKHEGNSSNIVLVNYNSFTDDFLDTTMITSDNFQNINPVGGEGTYCVPNEPKWQLGYCI